MPAVQCRTHTTAFTDVSNTVTHLHVGVAENELIGGGIQLTRRWPDTPSAPR
jgi:hypothetical protein